MIGRVVSNHFEILELLGSGGMGSVYKAKHVIIGKNVAIKILSKNGDDKANMRFQQEAKAASSLNHPNIVSVLDFGCLDNDQPFIVMDLAVGSSLADALRDYGTLSNSDALSIFAQICSALAHAHQRGIVHRDLKPGNIMLCPDDNGKIQAKLVDFGIAKIQALDTDRIQSLTETGEIFGSPLYMSPEQCAGSDLDARSDFYSLGCVMYECLTGKPPFTGQNVMQTIFMHVNDEAVKITNLNPRVPEELEQIVSRCLQKKAAARYSSAADIETDLLAVSENPQTKLRSKTKLSQDHKSKVPLDSCLVALGIVAGMAAVWFLRPAAVTVTSAAPASAIESTADRLTMARTLYTEGEKLFHTKQYAKANEAFLKAQTIFKELAPNESMHGMLYFHLAQIAETKAWVTGDYSATIENYRRAKEIFAKHPDEQNRLCYRSASCAVGNILNKPETALEANKEYLDAVASDLKDNLRGSDDLMVHATALANNYATLGNVNEAEKWYKLALNDGE